MSQSGSRKHWQLIRLAPTGFRSGRGGQKDAGHTVASWPRGAQPQPMRGRCKGESGLEPT